MRVRTLALTLALTLSLTLSLTVHLPCEHAAPRARAARGVVREGAQQRLVTLVQVEQVAAYHPVPWR